MTPQPVTLTDTERQRVLLEAQLAKIDARLGELQAEAQGLLERNVEPQGVVTQSHAEPLIITLTVDLHRAEPNLFRFVANKFEGIVTEVRAAMQQAQDLRGQLQALRDSAPMLVQVSFPRR